MGVRDITVVVSNGQHRLAQYSHWGGMMRGIGVLRFCQRYLNNEDNRRHFAQKLSKVRFLSQPEIKSFLSKPSWGPEVFHCLSPDWKAHSLLKLIWEGSYQEILAEDYIRFTGNSLHCEWASVIDLDTCTFEVYSKPNVNPIPSEERFSKYSHSQNGIYAIGLTSKFSLDNLPTQEEYLRTVEECELEHRVKL